MKKQLISLLLAAIMATSLLPATAWAEAATTADGGAAQEETIPETPPQDIPQAPAAVAEVDNEEPLPTTQEDPTPLSDTQEEEPAPVEDTDSFIASGTCGKDGDNLTWTLDDQGTLTITGTGEMKDYYSSGTAPWYDHASAIKKVTIEEGVTSVGRSAFYQLGITDVSLADSIVSIGNFAFYYVKGLKTLVLPESLMTIGYSAFEGCSNLSEISGGQNLVTIDELAFYFCSALETIEFGSKVDSIAARAFSCCSRLTAAFFQGNAPTTFDGNITTGTGVFEGTSSNFTIFYRSGTTGWTSPTWNGYPAVCRDDVATDFSTLDSDNRNVQGIYFQLNTTAMTATVGKNTNVDNNAGYAGGQNGSIVIPDTVTKGESTYTVIGINQYAFSNCAWINTISLGKNISSVEPSAFRGCKNLTAITVSPDNLQFADQDGVLFDKCGLYLYAYPAGRTDSSYTIPDSCDTVGTMSFYSATNLTSLSVPNSVKSIGAQAFAQCNALEEAVLPFFGGNAESTSDIGFAFNNDWDNKLPANLKRITVCGTNLPREAFRWCSNLEEIYLPDCHALTVIPDSCFSQCSSLHTLSFGGNAPSRYGMITIPDAVVTIESSAFESCKSIRGVTLGKSATNLPHAVFYNCVSIEQFAVAKGNTSFMADQWGVLYSADQTTLCYYPSGRAWPYYNVNAATTCIGTYAFTYCNNLVNLFVPESVTSFQTTGFDPCIASCPGTTICCYMGSPIARYAIENGLTPWYMDNYALQGITVEGLPEYVVVDTDGELLNAPYVTATYGDKKLQLDDYEVQFASISGKQALTFMSGNVSTEVEANVLRRGNVNGDTTAGQTDIDASDMQCLYTYLTTGENEGKVTDTAYFDLVSDINGDGFIDVYDLQRLYEAVSGVKAF